MVELPKPGLLFTLLKLGHWHFLARQSIGYAAQGRDFPTRARNLSAAPMLYYEGTGLYKM